MAPRLPQTGRQQAKSAPGTVLDRLALDRAGIWERRSCGAGTKGLRVYDWTAVSAAVAGQVPAPRYAHTVGSLRSVSAPMEVEFFLAHAPADTPVPELIDTARMRWKTEENNEHGKNLLGLTQYQVRKWTPWHRHVTIAMLALALLAVTRAALPADADETVGGGKAARSWRRQRDEARSALARRDPPRPGLAAHPGSQRHRSCPGLVRLPAAPPGTYSDQPLPTTR